MASFREKEIRFIIQYKDEKPIRLKSTIGALLKANTLKVNGYTLQISK